MNNRDLILHYAPDNASLVIRLALEECKVPYRTVLVDRRTMDQTKPEYLALNPNGLIPVLETEHGPIFETAAILLWITDTYHLLGPQANEPARGSFLKWLFFMSNTLHPALRMLFYTENYIGADKQQQAQLSAVTQRSVLQHLEKLNTYWGGNDVPLALTLYLGPMLRWLALYPANSDKSWFDLTQFPALFDAARALEQRDCTQCAIDAEGLGPAPFTAPRPPMPPEGSAI